MCENSDHTPPSSAGGRFPSPSNVFMAQESNQKDGAPVLGVGGTEKRSLTFHGEKSMENMSSGAKNKQQQTILFRDIKRAPSRTCSKAGSSYLRGEGHSRGVATGESGLPRQGGAPALDFNNRTSCWILSRKTESDRRLHLEKFGRTAAVPAKAGQTPQHEAV